MKNLTYRVADFPFVIILPNDVNANTLLPSFREFSSQLAPDEKPLFTFEVTIADAPTPLATPTNAQLKEDLCNDFGLIGIYTSPHGWFITVGPDSHSHASHMTINNTMTHACATLQPTPQHLSWMLTSMLHILFSQAIIEHQSILLHASVITLHGQAVLFMGKSGTGKSTHSQLWLKEYADAQLLNDDNPVVRLHPDGSATAYGTPWSGKTPCWRNASAHVAAMVRLAQSPVNRYTPLSEIEAFTAILPGCSVMRHSTVHHDLICTTAATLATTVPIARMECLPNADAAKTCHNAIFHNK